MKYTVENVLQGHPDKICDQISDALLDECLKLNKYAHTAIECLGTGHNVVVGGEIDGIEDLELDVVKIVNDLYHSIGYEEFLSVQNLLRCQSSQLKMGLIKDGAGDQGIMYGYAVNNKYNYLPYGVYLSSLIAKEIDKYRLNSDYLLPDGKIQIIVNDNRLEKLSVNIQHKGKVDKCFMENDIVDNVLSKFINPSETEFNINQNSNFLQGGFLNDTGLTGRKIIVDTYGGIAPHGGGAFSGKDPTKMDRTAAYMARFVAKNIVANGFANECTISVAYAFGEERPIMLQVVTEKRDNHKMLTQLINERFDFRPEAIIERLGLRQFSFLPTSRYGHFSNSDYPWEQVYTL